MKKEYSFSKVQGLIRGKYYKSYRTGHEVKIHHKNGETSVRYFKPEEGAVMLEPEVRKYFPDAESVNSALRTLIDLIPKRQARHEKRTVSLRRISSR